MVFASIYCQSLFVEGEVYCYPIKMFGLPLVHLSVMFFVSRTDARNRANRLLAMVVKNDV